MGYVKKNRDFHEARWDEPFIMEMGNPGERGVLIPRASEDVQRVSGSAADLIKMAMIAVKRRMEEEGVKSRLLLQIHDELILDVPDDEVEQMKKLVQDAMDHAMDLKVPLKAGIHTGRTWDEAK